MANEAAPPGPRMADGAESRGGGQGWVRDLVEGRGGCPGARHDVFCGESNLLGRLALQGPGDRGAERAPGGVAAAWHYHYCYCCYCYYC
eukprot:6289241-Pyramimonas_sp.AAC.1